jgi:hypothetical protein
MDGSRLGGAALLTTHTAEHATKTTTERATTKELGEEILGSHATSGATF